MIQYLVILLDDTSVSYCHYAVGQREQHLMPIDTLHEGITYAMRENLNVQFVLPDYDLPQNYLAEMDRVDHSIIMPAGRSMEADVLVIDGLQQMQEAILDEHGTYVLRLGRQDFFAHAQDVAGMLGRVGRLNVVITDVEAFTENDLTRYADALRVLSDEAERLLLAGHSVQANLLTDRMMLDGMNNCGAGDTTITLAPDGRFYVCPAFYLAQGHDAIGDWKSSVGDLQHGLDIRNPQLYRLSHAPICRHCDAWQCRRCVWLNRLTTYEVNTPSHQQCVLAHLERNASRALLHAVRRHGTFLPERGDISEETCLDPFDQRKQWEQDEQH